MVCIYLSRVDQPAAVAVAPTEALEEVQEEEMAVLVSRLMEEVQEEEMALLVRQVEDHSVLDHSLLNRYLTER